MKRLKKILISTVFLNIVLMMLFTNSVKASSVSNKITTKEYSERYKEYLNLSEDKRKNALAPAMYDVGIPINTCNNPLYKARMLRAGVNTRFTLQNVIPENIQIKNQMQTSSCWAFATLSSLETNLALINHNKGKNTKKVYDYSERHMVYATSKYFLNDIQNPTGYNKTQQTGGSWLMSSAYLANGYGAVPEEEMPFENNENTIDIEEIKNKTIATQICDTMAYPGYSTLGENEKAAVISAIKQNVQNYGSVFAEVHGDINTDGEQSCYNQDTSAKYCKDTTSHTVDHAVSIIGWDDDYSVDNFAGSSKPKSNGAWIVRNSWGEDFGDRGLMYVSYEDANISSSGMYGIVKALDTTNYDNAYLYDELRIIWTITNGI